MKRFVLHPAVLRTLKLIPVSLCFIIVVAALSIIYGFIAHRVFTLRYIFNANFLAGAILIAIGVVIMFVPSAFALVGKRWLEQSTFLERSFDSRENRQHKARIVLWFGLFCMVFTGLIQLLLSVVI